MLVTFYLLFINLVVTCILFSFLFTVFVHTFNVDVKYKYLLEGKSVCLMMNCARLDERQ